jgi:SAM-dependent methyltransferase
MRAAVSSLLRTRLANVVLAIGERTPLRRRLTSAVFDPATGLSVGTGDMERDWDERARRNPRFYVAGFDWQTEEEFRRSGERDLESIILRGLTLPPHAAVLEIGCGLGRLLRPMGARAEEVHGVDISSEMVRQAGEALRDLPNVHVHHTDGSLGMFPREHFDFCYSYTVFQHIPDRDAVVRYLRDAAAVLKPGGTFRFQICLGGERDPRRRRGGSWLGVVFTEAELREILAGCGLSVASLEPEHGLADPERWQSHIVTCTRAPGA